MKLIRHLIISLGLLSLTAPSAMATAEKSVATEVVSQQGTTVRVNQGHIELVAVDQAATFSLYSITGQLVKSVSVAAGATMTLDLPKGVYIVRCSEGQWVKRVMVR